MAVLVLVVLLLAMTGYSDAAAWCICRTDVSEAELQKNIVYACGAGADCTPIFPSGSCYNPNTVRAHCNWAVNSYFQKKSQATGSCDFIGTATITSSDPSQSDCIFPSTASIESMWYDRMT